MALAIFDLDDTLIHGDSATLWLQFMVHNQLAAPEMLDLEQQMMQAYHAGTLQMEHYMAFTLQPLRTLSISTVAAWVDTFVAQQILPRVYPEAWALLQHYQQSGWQRLIISATAEHLVGPISRALGVANFLAINLEQTDGCYSGNTQGVLSYQHGKVQRLNHWCQQQQQTLSGSHGYSDSINDLPLLSVVSQPHVVNPDARLALHATEQHWPQLNWTLPAP
jgi:HAD superfamily hydrolase (TIGR01490 family)